MAGVRLTADQRLVIERAYLAGLPQATIAALVGKHPSTISRGLRAVRYSVASWSHGPRWWAGVSAAASVKYSAKWSQREAARKARRPKVRRLDHAPLRKKVWELLRANWSPEQIAAMLPVLFPRDLRMRVSHETIYQSLFVQTKGELKRELTTRTYALRRSRSRGARNKRGMETRIPLSGQEKAVGQRAALRGEV